MWARVMSRSAGAPTASAKRTSTCIAKAAAAPASPRSIATSLSERRKTDRITLLRLLDPERLQRIDASGAPRRHEGRRRADNDEQGRDRGEHGRVARAD